MTKSNKPRWQIAPRASNPKQLNQFGRIRKDKSNVATANKRNAINATEPIENAPSTIKGMNAPTSIHETFSHLWDNDLDATPIVIKPSNPKSDQSSRTRPGSGQSGASGIWACEKNTVNDPPTDTITPNKASKRAKKLIHAPHRSTNLSNQTTIIHAPDPRRPGIRYDTYSHSITIPKKIYLSHPTLWTIS